MISPERLESLQTGWVRLAGWMNVAPADAYPVFDRLVAAYTEPHRHYHTLEHVAEMLKVVGRLIGSADPLLHLLVPLATWFHDAVYDPKASDNEERSARLADDELRRLGAPVNVRHLVCDYVRRTDHSAPMREPVLAKRFLLDADLAILAAAGPRYDRYAADIRKEYAHVPDEQYRAGRAAVLERFLARPRIYHTDVMFSEGEAAARRNLRAEIDRLHGGG